MRFESLDGNKLSGNNPLRDVQHDKLTLDCKLGVKGGWGAESNLCFSRSLVVMARASHQAEYICRISRDNAVREKGGSFEEVGVEELIIMLQKDF